MYVRDFIPQTHFHARSQKDKTDRIRRLANIRLYVCSTMHAYTVGGVRGEIA